jgi:O-antigen biosynthesis protein
MNERTRYSVVARIIALARRFSALERFVVLWLALAPLVLGLVVVLDVALDHSPVPPAMVIGYYLVLMAALGFAALFRLLQWRRSADLEPAPAPVALPPVELADRGPLADAPPSWVDTGSPALERLRAVRSTATFSRRVLVFFGMRSKSRWVREPLSYLVSAGRFDYDTLARLILDSEGGNESADLLLGDLDMNLLLSLSRMVGSQDLAPADNTFAVAALRFVAARRKVGRVTSGNLLYLTERLILNGELAIAREILNEFRGFGFTVRLLRADAMNPFHPNALQASEQVWLAGLNQIFTPHGFEPISLGAPAETAYDRLQALTDEKVTGGPLITVIMTCFEPDHELKSAVASVIAQTWQNWELIIADDASPAEFQTFIDEVAAADPRIRVLRATSNAGTYVRRNEAIVASQGEFVTMHDSDDWAHPRRLEVQARHLQANPTDVANLSYSVRVSEHLMFVQPRGATLRLTESSLMFRKETVVARIGYFDSVRKAADSEYRLRIEAAFGKEVTVVDTLSPMALIRYTASSLSGSDLGDNWMHPARVAYRSARDRWHAEIRTNGADPYLPFPLVERPFPVHHKIAGAPAPQIDLDVILVVDARTDSNTSAYLDALAADITSLTEGGKRVGLMQFEAMFEGRIPVVVDSRVQRLIDEGVVVNVLPEDAARTDVAIVRHASLLQTAPSSPSSLSAARVVVFDDAASGRDRRGQNFARVDVEQMSRHIFGATVEWKVWDQRGLHAVVDVTVKESAR